MDNPLLSICIPTYNRAEYLGKGIESVVCQEEFKNKEVEIVISDNVSTDDTEKIGREYSEKYDNIHYYRNEVNVNNDNFPLVLSRGSGVLRRLCNDTLVFNDGALKYICDVIRKYRDSRPFICWLENNAEPEVREFDFRDGIRDVSYFITSIARFSIWDSECDGLEKDTYGAELLLWQVRKTLELASEKDSMVVVNKALTYTQTVEKKNISYGLYHVFYENYFTLMAPFFDDGKLKAEDREYLEKDLLLNFFPYWCVQWKMQNSKLQYSKSEDLCECVYQQYHNKPYWKEYSKKCNLLYLKLRIKGILKKVLGRE